MVNPLFEIEWTKVRLISLDDDGVLTVRLEGQEPRLVQFPSREDMEAAFEEWLKRESRRLGEKPASSIRSFADWA